VTGKETGVHFSTTVRLSIYHCPHNDKAKGLPLSRIEPVQAGPGAYPPSSTIRTGSFPGVKQPGRSVNPPSPSSAEIKERVELYLYSPSLRSWQVYRVKF
jgi:hypothetical protein